MTFLTTTAGNESILPTEFADLITAPVLEQSIAFNPAVATTVQTAAHKFNIPVLREDAGAEWVEEGGEIAPDDPQLDEVSVIPSKVAGLTLISRELAEDSSPDAQNIVGQSLARSIINQVDKAFMGNLAAPAPKGLGAVTPDEIVSDALILDVFTRAVGIAESKGANLTAFIVHPNDATKLANLKDADGSNRRLLENPRMILDRPVIVNKHAVEGTIWAVPKADVYSVLREGTTLAKSDAPFFTSDRIAIRATSRIGFGFPYPENLVKITVEQP